jgi:hypothetical protein
MERPVPRHGMVAKAKSGGADGRWMTFSDLAEVRRISQLSAAKLVRRHNWRRQRDNRGHVRAFVPFDWAKAESDSLPDNSSDGLADICHAIRVLEDAVSPLSADS